MGEPGVSQDVAEFIAEHIHSVYQLEVLLLVQRTAPRAWSAAQVASELRIDSLHAEAALDDLAGRGLLAKADAGAATYTYAPASSEISAVVAALVKAYAERHLAVIQMIFSRPPEKVDAVRAFADAFRIGKKEGQ